MILVTLGTQDKDFSRLLKTIDKEIENNNIKDKVIVQAGYTKYKSKNMEIFDLVDEEKLNKLVKKCDLLITHGGVGSILLGIKSGKKVIAAPRLKKYKEHTNDHQKQIVKEFSKEGYILELEDFSKLVETIKKSKRFKPKKYKSNNKNFSKIIDNYIKEDNHISWYNKYRIFTSLGYMGICRTFINVLIFSIFFNKYKLYMSVLISFFITLLIELIFNIISNIKIKEKFKYLLTKIITLSLDLNLMYLVNRYIRINLVEAKFIIGIAIIIINYMIIKYCYGKDL